MEIIPLLDKVVLEPIEVQEKTESGLFLPASSKEMPSLAKVVAVGKGGFVDGSEVKMIVNTGDKVLYSRYAGSECKLDGKKFIVIKQADILAIIKD